MQPQLTLFELTRGVFSHLLACTYCYWAKLESTVLGDLPRARRYQFCLVIHSDSPETVDRLWNELFQKCNKSHWALKVCCCCEVPLEPHQSVQEAAQAASLVDPQFACTLYKRMAKALPGSWEWAKQAVGDVICSAALCCGLCCIVLMS